MVKVKTHLFLFSTPYIEPGSLTSWYLIYFCCCADLNEILQQLKLYYSNQESSGKEKNTSNAFKVESSHFEFSSISTQSNQESSSQSTSLKHPTTMESARRHYRAVPTGKLKMPPLSKFTSFHKDTIIMAKHQVRLDALGDKCPQDCSLNDAKCNCKKLFACVTRIKDDGECVDQKEHPLKVPVI